jgi:Mg2+/Co2+ transporter CorB|tara:strand:- start:1076 stop:1342 length:267 start_codon:yes stop_codon:yes gene_type:complete
MKHEAIYNLYSNAKTINENADGFEVKDINGDVISIDMSAVNTKATELQTEEDNKVTAKANAKISGNTKLLDLGLTQAEATALTGYTPE